MRDNIPLIDKVERIYPTHDETFTTSGMSDKMVYSYGRQGLLKPIWKNHYFAKDVHDKIYNIKKDIEDLSFVTKQKVFDIFNKHLGELIEPNNNFKYGGEIKDE